MIVAKVSQCQRYNINDCQTSNEHGTLSMTAHVGNAKNVNHGCCVSKLSKYTLSMNVAQRLPHQ